MTSETRAAQDPGNAPGTGSTQGEGIRAIGGLLAVIAGVIVARAAISKNTQIAATIA